MRFDVIEAFVAVVEVGSFVGAAQRLNQSKAAVSKQVAYLEDEVGARLLNRTTRSVSLTPDGLVFVARCRELLQQWHDATDEISDRKAQARGLLRINVPVSYGISHLAPLWAGFMTSHPQVRLDVTLSDRVVDLVDEGFDLAIRIGQLPSSSLISRRLTTCRLIACASPQYLSQCEPIDHPDALAVHRVLSYSLLSSGDTWVFTSRDAPAQHVSVRVSPVMRSNNGDTCRDAAVQGQGVVMQPDFLVDKELQTGRLVQVMPDWQGQQLGIYAVYPSRRHLSAKVRLLIEYLSAQLYGPVG